MNLKDPLITILIKKTPFNNNSKNDNISKNQNKISQPTTTLTHQPNNLILLKHNGGAEQPQQSEPEQPQQSEPEQPQQSEPEQSEPEQSEPVPITGEHIMKVFVKILEIIDSRKG